MGSVFNNKRKDKSWKMISLEQLRSIPDRLRQERAGLEQESMRRRKKLSQKRWAILVRNEFLIRFAIATVLRSRNIREAKLGKNVRNKSDGTWQVVFEGDETKTGNKIGLSLPEWLVPYLREYLENARPILAGNCSSGLLFFSKSGRPLASSDVYRIVRESCLKYSDKPVNPHLIRDIVATAILRGNHGDYLKVSKLLGHEN